MNRQVFKAVWNASTQSWVAAPETAKSHSHSCHRVSRSVSRLSALPGAVAACFRLP
ncbi:MAG: ESPR-type extended signal peptide-containing protein, partial [Azovibrio sp.]